MCFIFIHVIERKWACTPEHKVKYFSIYSDVLCALYIGKIELSHLRENPNIWSLFWCLHNKCRGGSNSWNSFLEGRLSPEQCWLVRSHYSDATTLFTCLIPFEAHTQSDLWYTGNILVKKHIVPSAASTFINYNSFVLT